MEKSNKHLSSIQEKTLTKQGYRIIGNHSAVKICNWTRNMIRGKGGCYKYAFYGIRSHQCLQMTTSMYCANRCKFCWRGLKAPVSKQWYGNIDSPKEIIEQSIKAQINLLQGNKGNKEANKQFIKEMENIRHVALSLTGEPITYPKINEIIKEFHKRKISTFLVTNAQFPEEIKNIDNITQLYLSIDAPNKELLKKIDSPLFPDFWERMLSSLDILKTKNYRKCIRLTLIKDENIEDIKGYANLINRGEPDFIEIKSYMWVGDSQKSYSIKNMPNMKEVKDFTDNLLKLLPEYEFAAEHIPSRVTLIIKKSLNKKQFIDFNKFFNLIESKSQFIAEDYSSKVMMTNN
ncbi:MAG: 4-demethylwyosine synthase TYW1 [Candidatus Pacearchaeota archaeon]|jgi:tRNA wybutosine-synthesizing protein 1